MPPRKRFRYGAGKTKYGKRHTPGKMNATEALYAEILEDRKRAGEVLDWHFEQAIFVLARNSKGHRDMTYTPDFMVVRADGEIEFIDTKGSGPIDPKSIVKIRCAAERYWYFTFAVEQRQTKKAGNGWKRTEY
jgi:hypothetical protein